MGYKCKSISVHRVAPHHVLCPTEAFPSELIAPYIAGPLGISGLIGSFTEGVLESLVVFHDFDVVCVLLFIVGQYGQWHYCGLLWQDISPHKFRECIGHESQLWQMFRCHLGTNTGNVLSYHFILLA